MRPGIWIGVEIVGEEEGEGEEVATVIEMVLGETIEEEEME